MFEAVPVQAWYNFLPDIDYSTLTSDEVEQEFSKRDRTLSYFTTKYQIGGEEQDEISKVRRKDDDHNLVLILYLFISFIFILNAKMPKIAGKRRLFKILLKSEKIRKPGYYNVENLYKMILLDETKSCCMLRQVVN